MNYKMIFVIKQFQAQIYKKIKKFCIHYTKKYKIILIIFSLKLQRFQQIKKEILLDSLIIKLMKLKNSSKKKELKKAKSNKKKDFFFYKQILFF